MPRSPPDVLQELKEEPQLEAEIPIESKSAQNLLDLDVVEKEESDKLQYRLFSDDGDFLMYARANLEARRISFYLYNPSEKGVNLFNAEKPAFAMTWNSERTEWRLVQERCENCQFSPKHLTCSCYGKQQPVGDGIFNCMEIHVPGLYADGSRVVWCPLLGRGDLSIPIDDSYEAQKLMTKQPSWNEEVESLVLDFKGRHILSSAKNFQLALWVTQSEMGLSWTACLHGSKVPETRSRPLPVWQDWPSNLQSRLQVPIERDSSLWHIIDNTLLDMRSHQLRRRRIIFDAWQEIESLRGDKAGIEEHYQGQLQELKKTMVGDVQRLQDFESRK
eukprot:g8632.t1